MLSRSILRSLPRTTSRFASYSTRTAIRPALQSSIRRNIVSIQPLKATLTTSAARQDSVAQELSAKLTSEIDLEQENDDNTTDSNNNAQTFLQQNDFWTLEDTEGASEVIMKRQYDDETITVSFNIADMHTPPLDQSYEEPDEAMFDEEEELGTAQSGGGNTKGAINQGPTKGGNIKVAPEDSIAPGDREELRNEEDEYDASQEAFPANVNVLIQRSSGKGALRINLVAYNGQFTTHGVTHLPESSSSPAELLRDTPPSTYTGPPFQQLDEELQDLLGQYLDARGINTALALFIPDYIDVKEQKEYLGWLGRVKEFVE